jgi:hypothetical protein
MQLPNWMYRRMAEPAGIRLHKRPVIERIPLRPFGYSIPKDRPCALCGDQVPVILMLGAEQLQGEYRAKEFFHTKCLAMFNKRVEKKNMPGNLAQDEYRFWVGSRAVFSTMGVCRACLHTSHGALERIKHLADDKCTIDGDRCAQRLVRAYKELLKHPLCLVCKKERYTHDKWGVPICARPGCEDEWKFGLAGYPALRVILKTQLDHHHTQMVEKANALGKRPWCSQCGMYTDNEAHEEQHKAWQELFDEPISGSAC